MNKGRYTCIFGRSSEIQWSIMNQVHSERKRCLVDKLGWDLKVCDGLEFDQFDRADTEYLVVLDDGFHACSLRIHQNPINRSLISAISEREIDSTENIWEISRFISSNFSFSTSEYILFSAIHYIFRGKDNEIAYTTLSKPIARMYRMFGMTIELADNLNKTDGNFFNYRIDTSRKAFEKFFQKAPTQDAAYLRLLEQKWEGVQSVSQRQFRCGRIARPQFIGNLNYEEMIM